MAKHKLYDETPEMKRGDDGKMSVKKPEKKESAAGDTGEPDSGGLKELLKQHKEMKDMHDKHEADMMARITKHAKDAGVTSGSNDVGDPLDKIEKGAK